MPTSSPTSPRLVVSAFLTRKERVVVPCKNSRGFGGLGLRNVGFAWNGVVSMEVAVVTSKDSKNEIIMVQLQQTAYFGAKERTRYNYPL